MIELLSCVCLATRVSYGGPGVVMMGAILVSNRVKISERGDLSLTAAQHDRATQ